MVVFSQWEMMLRKAAEVVERLGIGQALLCGAVPGKDRRGLLERFRDDEKPLRGVFIRAPRVRDLGSEVEVLAEHDGEPVLVRDGRFIVASFHPELTDDTRVHELFLDEVREAMSVRA